MAESFQKLVRVWKIGKIDFEKGLRVQHYLSKLHENPENTRQNTLLCLEHPPVYTIGIRTKQYNLEQEIELKKTGASFHKTNRGGLITFHGPGQLVVYPILNLKQFKPSIRWYVNQIENTVIDLCSKFGLNSETSLHTGVWIGDNKICAIGIHGSRFITTHGLALNCNTDLTWYDHIVPCGIEGKGVTSLTKELKRNVTVEKVIPQFVDSFCNTFKCDSIEFEENESRCILEAIETVNKVDNLSNKSVAKVNMNNFLLNKALESFEEVIGTPTNFLDESKQILKDVKLNIKEVYDFTKKEEIQPLKNNSLSKLFVKDLDSEQIWQQVEIQNDNVFNSFINQISVLLVDTDNLQFKDLENNENNSDNSDSEDVDNFEEAEEDSGNRKMNYAVTDTVLSTGESSSDSEERASPKKQASSSIDDNFFKLSEMENFLNAEERKLAAPDPSNQSDSNESEEEGSVDLFKENSDASLEEEDESKLARFKDYFVAKEETKKKAKTNKIFEDLMENDEKEPSDEIKSSLQIRQEHLKKKIDKLEEQAVSEKPWQLKGEINAESRPQNSLLAEVVGFDLTSRPAPVITEQASLQLEEIIRQRIKDKVFDSVERKHKPVETILEYKKKTVLDQEKSKQSLTQIYEAEYSKQQADLDPENLERQEEEPQLHNEVKVLMRSLFTKLDALSNFHFTSKPSIPELKIVSHLPAIHMEEVAPVAASDAMLLAPEEIKNKHKTNNIGKGEKTISDKKRERRRKKLKQKIHSQLKLKKENLKQASIKEKKGLTKT